ncbi:MAG: pyruvate kinase [Dehalococcoidia bacterium]|nr:pyruvate kinase [Dehalococcoidia bacterium]
MNHPAFDLRRRTKIVCTIGPASGSHSMIERMIKAGMNVARLNLSHGDGTQHAVYFSAIRSISEKTGLPVAILMDTPGPKYRVGELKSGQAVLKKGAEFVLTTRRVDGDEKESSVNLPNLPHDVKPRDLVLVDDGAIQLRVREVSGSDVRCVVLVGGVLKPRKGITVPGMRRSAPFLTDETAAALKFAARQKPDFIALSFVTGPDDVVQAREYLTRLGAAISLISKIETRHAVADFDRILQASDGIMVARGDMGVELPLPKVPLVQKDIIRKCNKAGKPVITATQMLESMISSPRPTRAEVADVANAIFDGTDAVMLSAETSVGRYPLQAIRMMVQIARETDPALPYTRILHDKDDVKRPQTDDAISFDACHTAYQLRAKAIIAFTQSGSTAMRVSRYRPKAPVLAITTVEAVRHRLALSWGVYAFDVPEPQTVDDLFQRAADLSKEVGVARKGDLVVVTAGIPISIPGSTNLLKVVQIG